MKAQREIHFLATTINEEQYILVRKYGDVLVLSAVEKIDSHYKLQENYRIKSSEDLQFKRIELKIDTKSN